MRLYSTDKNKRHPFRECDQADAEIPQNPSGAGPWLRPVVGVPFQFRDVSSLSSRLRPRARRRTAGAPARRAFPFAEAGTPGPLRRLRKTPSASRRDPSPLRKPAGRRRRIGAIRLQPIEPAEGPAGGGFQSQRHAGLLQPGATENFPDPALLLRHQQDTALSAILLRTLAASARVIPFLQLNPFKHFN